MVMGNLFHYVENTHFLEQTINPESLQQFQVNGPVLEGQIVKILDQHGLEIANPSLHNHETATHVVITRGTNRFVDEVHDHKVELRPSTELLSGLQKSEGRESCVDESNNSNKETCANNVSSPPNSSSLFKKNIILTNERK